MESLIGKTSAEISELVTPHMDRAFRGRQVARWVVDRNAASFAEMTDLPKSIREDLALRFSLEEPRVLESIESADGSR